MPVIGLIDYGAGNYTSVSNALEHLEIAFRRIDKPEQLEDVTQIILPGVGAFAAAMQKLGKMGIIEALKEQVVGRQKPFLGICVGMQILASIGREFEECPGLGLIEGTTEKIDAERHGLRLPHIGWNELDVVRESPLLAHMPTSPVFYFVHSYHLVPKYESTTLATCNYGQQIVSILQRENIFGVQFHPEKSQHHGLQLLTNFARL